MPSGDWVRCTRGTIVRLSIILGAALLVGGCRGMLDAMTISLAEPQPYYPATAEVSAKNKHTWILTNLEQYRQYLYVRHPHDPRYTGVIYSPTISAPTSHTSRPMVWYGGQVWEVWDFFRESFARTGYFQNIVDYPGSVPAGKASEKFLVADYEITHHGENDVEFHIWVSDGRTEEVLFHASHRHFRFGIALDTPLFFPVFNAFIDWKNDSLKSQLLDAPSASKADGQSVRH